ncbi:cell wall-binding repeat-containing protein [Microbacterium invictum]|uniref:Cell wall-binding protein/SH3-like domain-containing protein n=1 Tax=Microbacterium invictum TaxID=515415 RepID=A0AA40VLV8_9MICO|nr:cell wall-binding repeat-containing protein [Microbacterium invictum]MBB4139784.1 putative cell wall-binding protein/SH3-like domain-containing protein [Microbacterium invictum]
MLHTLDRRRATSLKAVVAAVAIALIAGMMSLLSPAPAQAADLPGSILEGGFIISDAEFFDGDAMTAAQIQTFLNGKVATCKATSGNPTCLKSFKGNLPAKAADRYCKAVAARSNTTAAQIIADVGKACGISQKVILVMLQKEQGLVTSTAPSAWNYRAAMGQSCPDTAPCSEAAAGFVNQVYLGARQQQVYVLNPNSFNYKPGQVNTIKWHPSSSCGTSKVYIQNQATANLYIYTPYRPNIAALAAGSGTGDKCSTYGNRNFYNFYVSWFAPDASSSTGAPAQIAACTVPAANDIAARSGTAKVTAASLNVRTAPTEKCTTGMTSLSKGATVTTTGTYGMWTRISSGGKQLWVASEYLDVAVTGTPAGSGNACAVPTSAAIAASTGYAAVTTGTLNARKAPSTACETGKTQITQGSVYERTGTYGEWWRLMINGSSFWAHSDYLSDAVLTPEPTVSGTAVAGQILTAKTGTWWPKPSSFAYQWKRDGQAIKGATSATYRVTNDDAGRKVTLTATAKITGQGSVAKTSAAVTATGYTSTRVAGADRYETAVQVSKAAYPTGAKTVYLATGADFADALAVAPLAATKDASLLLAQLSQLPASTSAELKRLAPAKVVLVGGTGVLDSKMADRLKSLLGSSLAVERLAGADRYETARKVAAAYGTATTVYLATGFQYADALGAAAVAGANGSPVVLVQGTSSTLDTATLSLLGSLKATKAVIVGGEGAVSKGIASQLSGRKLSVTRYGGLDRYATNASLNSAAFSGGVKSVVVATGTDFPDALAGSVLAAGSGSPLIVSSSTCASPQLADFLLKAKSTSVTLVGGTGVLGPQVARLQRC